MKVFKNPTEISFAESFQDFLQAETFHADDCILASESIYDRFLKEADLPCSYISFRKYGKGEPDTDRIDAIRRDLPKGIRRMFAIGGGAVMDTAKLLSLQTSAGTTEALFDLRPEAEKPVKMFDIIALPTTCGTGSEVTCAAAAELVSLRTKRGLSNDLMYPVRACLIPELLMGLPYRFFATSSIDALIHAVESYLSPKATAISELYSEKALRMIVTGYQHVAEHGPESWKELAGEFMTAATMAGLAFNAAGCAAVHALSYPLGGSYHIPHGEANQLMLSPVFRKYKEKQPVGKLNRLEEILGEILGTAPANALEAAFALFDEVQPRKPLREYGIQESELRAFAEGVMVGQQRLLGNSYVALTVDEMTEIYRSVW